MALIVCTWRWGHKYAGHYAERLRASVTRNLKQEHRFAVFSPGAEDEKLTEVPGCFARLRMFDPAWQDKQGFRVGDRIVCLDLDNVITGPLDHLFDIDDRFAILQGANAANPCPYNGSVWMLRVGHRPDVWKDFSVDAASALPFHEFPDDQGWMAAKLPGAKSWKVAESGIYGFKKPGWQGGAERLPENASIVAFFGQRDPSQYTAVPWVKEHWR